MFTMNKLNEKFYLTKSNMQIFSHSRCRADIDNQLGLMHTNLQMHSDDEYSNQLVFTTNPEFDRVFIAKDVLDRKLSEIVRDFVHNIPFDASLPITDDYLNQPRNVVFPQVSKGLDWKNCVAYHKSSPNEWIWEHYSEDIWRALPLTMESFLGSPILELIDQLERLWWKFIPITKSMAKTTWVLQRVDQGKSIDAHTDDWPGRRTSFVYYLTPDDWNSAVDGGGLCVQNSSGETTVIEPTFNTIVSWDMNANQHSPLHWVQTVKAPSSKPRISLVGFWSDK